MRGVMAFLLAAGCAAADTAAGPELFRAIRNDDLAAVRTLLGSADVNTTDAQGATALMHAALYASPACLKLLLERGADPNRSNRAGATALIWASADTEKIRLLLARHANANARARSGGTALMAASAVHGNLPAVKLLLDAGADVKARDQAGRGAVWAAAEAGDAGIVTELLARGGDPNEQDQVRLGQTALMNAAANQAPEAVRVLLKAGAEVDRRSRPPIQVKAGLQDRGQMTALLWAAAVADRASVELLLGAGADANVKEFRGMNALMLAVTSERQDPALPRLLLGKTADVNARDKKGLSAFDWALKWGESGIARTLREAGATGAPAREPAPEPASKAAGIRQAVEKSVALLQVSNRQFFRASGCAGCHHQMLGGMLVGLARRKGLAVNDQMAAEQIKEILAEREPGREALLQRQRVGGYPMRDSLLLVSLAAQNYAADAFTDALIYSLMGGQLSDGSWHGEGNRPPLEYSPFSETAYVIRAMEAYAPPGWRAEVRRQVGRAAEWLARSTAEHNEEKTMQLLGLGWAGAAPQKRRELGARLLAEQRADGGWAQRAGFPSDAYATGQALYALHDAAGIAVSDAAWQKGMRFLLDTQHEDGSWHVTSRAVKFQPYFESGFPYGHEQWISAAGTAWAGMALTEAVER